MQKINLEVDLNKMLKNLEIKDLEALIKEASALITKRKAKSKKSLESTLLYQLNHVFIPSQEHLTLFFQLTAKRKNNSITKKELKKLQALIDEEEAFQVKRIQILGELSNLWNMSILEVVEKLGLKPLESA